jgi:hypothetical protein
MREGHCTVMLASISTWLQPLEMSFPGLKDRSEVSTRSLCSVKTPPPPALQPHLAIRDMSGGRRGWESVPAEISELLVDALESHRVWLLCEVRGRSCREANVCESGGQRLGSNGVCAEWQNDALQRSSQFSQRIPDAKKYSESRLC